MFNPLRWLFGKPFYEYSYQLINDGVSEADNVVFVKVRLVYSQKSRATLETGEDASSMTEI